MDKKIKKIIKLLYDLKTNDEFYFTTYGTDLLEDLINSVKEEAVNNFVSKMTLLIAKSKMEIIINDISKDFIEKNPILSKAIRDKE